MLDPLAKKVLTLVKPGTYNYVHCEDAGMRIDITDPTGDQLRFDWDPGTGELSGPDGWWVERTLGLWDGFAALAGEGATVPNPRHSVPGMALFLLAQGFVPPDELRAELPGDDRGFSEAGTATDA
jgi:hypothetical protein